MKLKPCPSCRKKRFGIRVETIEKYASVCTLASAIYCICCGFTKTFPTPSSLDSCCDAWNEFAEKCEEPKAEPKPGFATPENFR